LLCATNSTLANIYVWEGNPAHCTISHVDNTIQINVAGTYGFRAWNPETEELEDLQNITIDSGVSGPVSVMIAYDEGGDNGAVNLRQGDLTVDGQEVYLGGLEISGSIATTGDFICDNITGTVDIDGDIGVTAGTRKFFVQNAEAAIIVHGSLKAYNTLEAETLGDVEICSHPTQGDIAIKNDYAGTLTIHPTMYGDVRIGERDAGGNVTTASELTGTLDFRSQLLGDVDITDGLATEDDVSGRVLVGSHLNGGHILVAGAVAQADPNLPAIHVQGDIRGSAGSDPAIEVAGELAGVVAVDGDLGNAASGVEIYVGSIDLEGLGAIAIDYDGYDADDEWADGATIQVGVNDPYSGNTPDARVYEITNCKGDMNNNGELEPGAGGDLEALSELIDDPSDYAEDFPGLYGSRNYHGDMDCDSQLDATEPAIRITGGVVGSIVLEKCSGLTTRRTLRSAALCD
jgi:hypothetical protein